jgi:Ethylbenzene dehydrogenase
VSDRTISRKDALVYGGAAAGGLVVGGAAVAGLAAGVEARKLDQPVEGAVITAALTGSAVPADDPDAGVWRDAQRVRVPLVPQQLVQPYLDKGGVGEIVVGALHDGNELALLLEWDDRDLDDLDGIRRYHDAVAVQLPTRAGPAPSLTMGAPGFPVHILQWRATWQRDIDSGGRTGVDQIYPEVVHDVMPDDVLPPETAQLYWVGREAGNPLSLRTRTTPIEEIVAEGFGTVTHLSRQTATGHGNHAGERWKVVLVVPSARAGVGEPLAPGTSWPIAFAVWLGSEENRGGRKHIAEWQTLVLEAEA